MTETCEGPDCVAQCGADEIVIAAFCTSTNGNAFLSKLISPNEVGCSVGPTAAYTITATCLAQ